MKRAIFPISGDCMNSPEAPIMIKDGQKVVCHKFDGSIYDIDALKGKVCIILCDDEEKGVCKEVWGIDELTNTLLLKYYLPEQKKIGLKIDRIKEIYIVEAVCVSVEDVTIKESMEKVKTCKIYELEPIFMVKNLGKISDKERAFKLIEETFRKQLGAKSDNKWFVSSGLFEKEGITLKEFINETDEKKLFPHLVDECKIIADEQLKQPNENERAKRYLDNFIEKWRNGNINTSPNPEPQQENPKPTRGRGRPKETFKDKMIDDTDGRKLQRVHVKINGKKGKDFSLIILACIKKGWLVRPTYTQAKNEFGDIGTKTGYNKYLNDYMFTKEELEGAINSLDYQ